MKVKRWLQGSIKISAVTLDIWSSITSTHMVLRTGTVKLSSDLYTHVTAGPHPHEEISKKQSLLRWLSSSQAQGPEFDPWNPHCEQRKPTSANCSLPFISVGGTCMPSFVCVCVCVHASTHIYTYMHVRKFWRKKKQNKKN